MPIDARRAGGMTFQDGLVEILTRNPRILCQTPNRAFIRTTSGEREQKLLQYLQAHPAAQVLVAFSPAPADKGGFSLNRTVPACGWRWSKSVQWVGTRRRASLRIAPIFSNRVGRCGIGTGCASAVYERRDFLCTALYSSCLDQAGAGQTQRAWRRRATARPVPQPGQFRSPGWRALARCLR